VSQDTAQRIRRIAETLAYQPNRVAQSMRGKRTMVIGMLTVESAPPVETRRLLEVERIAWEAGYVVQVLRSWLRDDDSMKAFIAGLRARHVDGLMVFGRISRRHTAGLIDEYAGLPTVFHGWAACEGSQAVVQPGVRAGMELALGHCIERGRRRIGAILLSGAKERAIAWQSILHEHGLPHGKDLLIRHQPGNEHIPTEASVTAALDAILPQRIDALVVENDYWAAAILAALHRRGIRVPADIAVIGYNNLDFTPMLYPALTTIDEREAEQARALFDAFAVLTAGKPHAGTWTIEPHLVVREST
jgi:DNA-binding LacI/PurR family transcriptional regulator